MTAEQLDAEMGCEEFMQHWADYQTAPWGEGRADLRSGIVAALFYNAHRGPHQPAKAAADFMPYREAENEADARATFLKAQRRRR
jgi:hypothetical protein